MEVVNNTYLKFIESKNFFSWDVKSFFISQGIFKKDIPFVLFGEFLSKYETTKIHIDDNKFYKILGVRTYGNGVFINREVKGNTLNMRTYQLADKNTLFWCKVDTKNGGFGIVKKEHEGGLGSSNMFFAKIDIDKINPEYLQLLFKSPQIHSYMDQFVTGTTNRKYIKPDQLLNEIKIPLPSLEEQNRIVEEYNKKLQDSLNAEIKALKLEKEIESYLMEELGIEVKENKNGSKGLKLVEFSKIETWGASKIILSNNNFKSSFHKMIKLGEYFELLRGVTYSKDSEITEGGYKVLRANNISLGGNINYNEIKYISDSKEKFEIKRKLKKNDLFICLASGSKDHIGKVAYIEDDIDYYFGGFMGAIRQKSGGISSMYLFDLLNSKLFNKYLSDRIFGVNINNLNSELLYNFSFPLPPLYIQEKIVKHIGDLKEEINNLKKLSLDLKESAKVEFEKEIFS